MNSHGKKVKVASVEVLHVPETEVYNFEVEGTHSYFAGEQGVWAHNYDQIPFITVDLLELHTRYARSSELIKNIIKILIFIVVGYILYNVYTFYKLSKDPSYHLDNFPENKMIFRNDGSYSISVTAYYGEEILQRQTGYSKTMGTIDRILPYIKKGRGILDYFRKNEKIFFIERLSEKNRFFQIEIKPGNELYFPIDMQENCVFEMYSNFEFKFLNGDRKGNSVYLSFKDWCRMKSGCDRDYNNPERCVLLVSEIHRFNIHN